MELARTSISNFRNFAALDVALAGNVVVVGENRVGKSNLLYALRLLLDPTLPDSARQLALSDFWDGLGVPTANTKITIAVEITGFEADLAVLAVLTDYRLADDPQRVRLVYEFRPHAGRTGAPESEEDFEFVCHGGEDEAKRFGHDLRRRLTLEVLPALRDVERDLGVWRRSPLRPLIEKAFGAVDADDLRTIADAVQEATEKLAEFPEVESLEQDIGALFVQMSGARQDIKPRLGFGPTDPSRLYRSLQLLIDEGERAIGDARLGSANLVFLTLKMLELRQMLVEDKRNHTLLCIEEPEAHLHPHLQRSVYRHQGTVYFHPRRSNFEHHAEHLFADVLPDSLVRTGVSRSNVAILYQAAWIGDAVEEAARQHGFEIIRADKNALYPRGSALPRWLELCAVWCCGGWRSGRPRFGSLAGNGQRLFAEAVVSADDRVAFERR